MEISLRGKNALVTGAPFIRYYSGAPLVYDGVRLGALCLIDYTPRAPLSDRERSVLTRLAEVVVHEMRTTRLIRESLAVLVG
ncbi:MAG: GAF domain-containing protein [Actinomycetota bacterium]